MIHMKGECITCPKKREPDKPCRAQGQVVVRGKDLGTRGKAWNFPGLPQKGQAGQSKRVFGWFEEFPQVVGL